MPKQDNVTELFEVMNIICEGEPAADVMCAIARLIAHGIARQATDKNPDTMFALLRESVDIELKYYRPRLVPLTKDQTDYLDGVKRAMEYDPSVVVGGPRER